MGDNGTMLGFVGLGVMGSRVVKRLMDAGHPVTGTNRTRSRADWLVEAGMQWADTPREVAESSEVVFSMVADAAALLSIADGPDGVVAGLGPGKVYVDMSSITPAASRDVAARVREAGASMLDSPVSGSVSTLEEGRLSLMVGGEEEAFRKVEPILREIGPVVTHVGGNGQAVTMKIATNLSLAVQILAFSEGVLLAEKSGIPRETAVRVLLNSVIASPMLKYRGPFVLEQPEEAWFGITMMQKDMRMALELGRELEVPLPTTAVTNQLLTAGRALGFGTKDFAALFDVLAAMSGVEGSG
ncbi:MAG TPA: NAD(P)-dependent oxidoreductase [Actinomycetota bacterium]|nr:NAD(P)-dependent oxidoreductase [Actinomycetota bacterium]